MLGSEKAFPFLHCLVFTRFASQGTAVSSSENTSENFIIGANSMIECEAASSSFTVRLSTTRHTAAHDSILAGQLFAHSLICYWYLIIKIRDHGYSHQYSALLDATMAVRWCTHGSASKRSLMLEYNDGHGPIVRIFAPDRTLWRIRYRFSTIAETLGNSLCFPHISEVSAESSKDRYRLRVLFWASW